MRLRRRAWQERELPLEPAGWPQIASRGPSPHERAAEGELLAALRDAIATALSPHQREVLVAITLDGVPIDVLSERLDRHARRALQDAARRAPQAARAAGRAGSRARSAEVAAMSAAEPRDPR